VSRRRTPPDPPEESGTFDPENAVRAKERLQGRVAEKRALNPSQPDYVSKAQIAFDIARSTVREVFGRNSDEAATFGAALIQSGSSNIAYGPFDDLEGLEQQNAELRAQEAIARLESLVRLVDEKTIATPSTRLPARPVGALSRRVFLVHGRDDRLKLQVAQTLKQLDLEPIILHEQPDRGRTIMEKLEDYVDVGFAVILMTGDDRGGAKDTPRETYQLRARQGVLLEMGLFLGRLSRARVCVLYEPDVERPSDYDGVLYKKLDASNAWRLELAREIRAAGIDVDFNRL
jgi:predicted nucleotide-binding protein